MAVEVGEVDVLARPLSGPAAAPGPQAGAQPASPSAAPSPQLTFEIDRAVALQRARDLRLHAD